MTVSCGKAFSTISRHHTPFMPKGTLFGVLLRVAQNCKKLLDRSTLGKSWIIWELKNDSPFLWGRRSPQTTTSIFGKSGLFGEHVGSKKEKLEKIFHMPFSRNQWLKFAWRLSIVFGIACLQKALYALEWNARDQKEQQQFLSENV